MVVFVFLSPALPSKVSPPASMIWTWIEVCSWKNFSLSTLTRGETVSTHSNHWTSKNWTNLRYRIQDGWDTVHCYYNESSEIVFVIFFVSYWIGKTRSEQMSEVFFPTAAMRSFQEEQLPESFTALVRAEIPFLSFVNVIWPLRLFFSLSMIAFLVLLTRHVCKHTLSLQLVH